MTLYFNAARATEAAGDTQAARRIYERLVTAHPHYTAAALRLASLARCRGAWPTAFALVKSVLQRTPMCVDAQAMHGWLLLESGNAEPAQKQLEHYLKAHDAAEAKAVAASAAKQLAKDGTSKDGKSKDGKDGKDGKEAKDVKAAAAHQRQARATAYLRLLAADALLERHAQQEHAHTAAKRCATEGTGGLCWGGDGVGA